MLLMCPYCLKFSNCQGLGRKNKHEILKTDRMSNNMYFALPTLILPMSLTS